MLFSRRKRLERIAEKERQGESFWSNKFTENVRIRIFHAFGDATGAYTFACASLARDLILRDEGKFFLHNNMLNEAEDFFEYMMACDDEEMPMVIEAMYQGMRGGRSSSVDPWAFTEVLKDILREARVSYEMINNQMVEFTSREMHVSVVAPVLELLAGDSKLRRVEVAYQDALKEISNGAGADAITDAGTALQELLTLLGCAGNALGPLIKSAKANGLIAAHDARMVDGIASIMHWVSADRSESGDAHSATKVSVEDAWLTVHVVGALILRLANSKSKRS
ncbi:hypothetical protein ACFFQW_04370 [Umezawaea endophytica]|uniref:Uncharacterized protein n=1 Tax=Umezawaea endophytica TaxID=1654476 RepID=A0A9X2VGY6_9PSEU|nr:hypothetical protein [Umezawaea endophytica]MCS7476396.1 hypothetical protein [Umezawaea endophytica]